MDDPVNSAMQAFVQGLPIGLSALFKANPQQMGRALAAAYAAEAADLLATDEFQSCIKQYFLNRAADLRAIESGSCVEHHQPRQPEQRAADQPEAQELP